MADAASAELAQQSPCRADERVDPNALGDCPIDREADWIPKVGIYPGLRRDEYWKLTRGQHPSSVEVQSSAI
jgi:hypothetical protein